MTRSFSHFSSKDLPSAPGDAADYWAAKHMLGTLSARDEVHFRSWLDDPVNATAYAEAQEVGTATTDIAADPAVLAMRSSALNVAPVSGGGVWRRIGAVAASAVLLTGLTMIGVQIAGDHGAPAGMMTVQTGASAVPGTNRYETRVGERRDITLDDGSVISLNTGSVIEVAYTSSQRDIRLLRGQALFQVAQNGDWPFVVAAGDRAVTAVGTAFDIRLDGSEVRVVLIEGKVRVAPLQRQGLQRLIPALGNDDLIPGQQLISTPDASAVLVNAADVIRETSWRNGQVIFRDDTIAAAVAELNRYSESPILVTDSRVAQLKVSGVFGTSRPENFVAAVTDMLPVEATEAGEATVLSWRDQG